MAINDYYGMNMRWFVGVVVDAAEQTRVKVRIFGVHPFDEDSRYMGGTTFGALPGGGTEAQGVFGGASSPLTAPGTGVSPGYPPDMSQAEIEGIIREEATSRGIDPNIAVRVFRSEGAGSYQSSVSRSGAGSLNGREASFGPYQLYTGGGLGNEYERVTGRSLVNDNTREGVTNQIRFALDKASQKGWGAWYGAAKVGVGDWDGIGGSRSLGNYSGGSGSPTPTGAPVGSGGAPNTSGALKTGGPAEVAVSNGDVPWAHIVYPVDATSIRHNLKVQDWVVGFFVDGRDSQQPIVIGKMARSDGAGGQKYGDAQQSQDATGVQTDGIDPNADTIVYASTNQGDGTQHSQVFDALNAKGIPDNKITFVAPHPNSSAYAGAMAVARARGINIIEPPLNAYASDNIHTTRGFRDSLAAQFSGRSVNIVGASNGAGLASALSRNGANVVGNVTLGGKSASTIASAINSSKIRPLSSIVADPTYKTPNRAAAQVGGASAGGRYLTSTPGS